MRALMLLRLILFTPTPQPDYVVRRVCRKVAISSSDFLLQPGGVPLVLVIITFAKAVDRLPRLSRFHERRARILQSGAMPSWMRSSCAIRARSVSRYHSRCVMSTTSTTVGRPRNRSIVRLREGGDPLFAERHLPLHNGKRLQAGLFPQNPLP